MVDVTQQSYIGEVYRMIQASVAACGRSLRFPVGYTAIFGNLENVSKSRFDRPNKFNIG